MHHPTDRIAHTTVFVTPVVEHWLERDIAQWAHEGSIRWPTASWANVVTTELHLAPSLMKARSHSSRNGFDICLIQEGERDVAPLKERSLMDRSFMVDALSYFSFQPVLHDWCNKGRGMCYFVCGIVHIIESLLLIGKSSLCSGGCGIPLSLSKWSFTICPTTYNLKCIKKICWVHR